MFLTNYNYGIKLIDLIDYNGDGTIDELFEQVNDMLTSNCKKCFYVTDDGGVLWADFIERFTRRFMFRTLSFDTYFNFCMKLCDVFTKNRVKLQRMYEVKMIKFNPLYNKNLQTDTNTSGTSKGKQTVERTDKAKENTNKNGANGYEDNGENKQNQWYSDTPKSTINVTHLTDVEKENNYITHAQGNSEGRTSKGKKNYNDNILSENDVTINGVTIDDFINSANGKSLMYGYDKDPTDLLKKYMNFVIDMNETLLEEIENEHLFMSIVV